MVKTSGDHGRDDVAQSRRVDIALRQDSECILLSLLVESISRKQETCDP